MKCAIHVILVIVALASPPALKRPARAEAPILQVRITDVAYCTRHLPGSS